jgi:4-amino-4-deoxy-L-arabinose transferase-like glycosyltransferase
MIPRLPLPPSRATLAVLAAAFVFPGLADHDPWKGFDVVAIEIARGMLASGDWLVPRVAGEPWLDDPPLYHWLAAAFGAALGGLLPFHNAARLASAAAMLAAFWFLYLAGRHSAAGGENGREGARGAGACAMLLLAGSVGLIVHAHEAVPDLAALAAACAAFLFLFRAARRPLAAGIGFGAALAVAFLATGLLVPAVLAVSAVAAHAACDELRTPRAPLFFAPALALPLLAAAAWALALWLRAPELAAAWWELASRARGEFGPTLRYYVVTASWYAWPAWPLALWAAWALRREWRTPRVFVPLVASLAALAAIAWSGATQDINATVLLAPLALLGAQGVASLRRGAAAALDWLGITTFGFFTALVWLGYVAMMTGWPPRIAHNFAKTAPGFVAQFEWLPLVFALALALGWLYLVLFAAPSPARGVLRWAAGVALLWGTFAMLWMPWADYQKSYRAVALQLRSRLPAAPGCIAGSGLGLPQRAALSYHAGIRTVAPSAACRYFLVQGQPQHEAGAPGPGWAKLADVGRPGDKSERYRLYRRETRP